MKFFEKNFSLKFAFWVDLKQKIFQKKILKKIFDQKKFKFFFKLKFFFISLFFFAKVRFEYQMVDSCEDIGVSFDTI